MKIGCPKEVKIKENRVGMVPALVKTLVSQNHKVLIEKGAGLGSYITDEEYIKAGAQIVENADIVWNESDMIIKVKEPISSEYSKMKESQILFTYLHLAAAKELTEALIEKKVKAIAYETVTYNGMLPLLKPMSEVAGRMSIQVGAWSLEKHQGGKGVLLGGVTGVKKSNVVILGGGVVGRNAAQMAVGMGANVTILDTNLNTLESLDHLFSGRVNSLYSNNLNIYESIVKADLVVGAVLITGAKAPRLVSKEMLLDMEKGTVIVDVAVDQGGCVETMRPTTHENPIYNVNDIIHYGVSNMPGAVAKTSTYALANATFPYAVSIANSGIEKICKEENELSKAIKLGVNVYNGEVTCNPVAVAHNLEFTNIDKII